MAPPKVKNPKRSAKYYRKNAAARRKKKKTDTKINSRPAQVRKRVESKRRRKAAKKRGINVRNKDYDHKSNRVISSSKNRGKKGEGGRKKKRKK